MERELLGHVTCPSEKLIVVDMGLLGLWSHLDPPLLDDAAAPAETALVAKSCVDYQVIGPDFVAASQHFGHTPGWLYDRPPGFVETFAAAMTEKGLTATVVATPERVPHRRRVDQVLAGGRNCGVVSFHGLSAPVIAGLPTSRELSVYGTRVGEGDYSRCWRHIELEVGSSPRVTTEAVGDVMVDWARLAFVDADALGAWEHEASLDGQADFVFWGRDAASAAESSSAITLDGGQFGWVDLPVEKAVARGIAVEELRETRGLKFATDFRPHSHHYLMMAKVRAAKTESGTIVVGDSRMCGFMTTWGDGVFPVERDIDAGGNLVAVRIILETPRSSTR